MYYIIYIMARMGSGTLFVCSFSFLGLFLFSFFGFYIGFLFFSFFFLLNEDFARHVFRKRIYPHTLYIHIYNLHTEREREKGGEERAKGLRGMGRDRFYCVFLFLSDCLSSIRFLFIFLVFLPSFRTTVCVCVCAL